MSKRVDFTLPDHVYDKLEQIASASKCKVSAIIKTAIRDRYEIALQIRNTVTTRKTYRTSYCVDLNLPIKIEATVKSVAKAKDLSVTSVILALIYKAIPTLPTKPVRRPYGVQRTPKAANTNASDDASSATWRVRLHISREWKETLAALAKEQNGQPQSTLLRDILETELNRQRDV